MKNDNLEREWQSEHVTEPAHQPRPQQTHLEAEHRPRHRTDGELHRRDFRPSPRQTERNRVGRCRVDAPRRSWSGRPRLETRQGVPPQRNRHLLPGREQARWSVAGRQQHRISEPHHCQP
jgi:hypothetical protein